MKRSTRLSILMALSALLLSACGGGGGGSSAPVPTSHTVTISWAANREAAVNTTGGGYIVAISGQPTIDVPYNATTGTTPTSTTATLMTGSYSVTVTAYSALKPTGSVSAAYSFTVPY